MDAEGRFEARNRRLRPLMEDFGRWLHANVGDVVPKSTLAKAVNNAINHLPHLMHVLDNGLFPLENNLAERYIRPYTVGRKNWEFSDTQNGARASAAIYSIVATARANGLVPGRYIDWLLEVMPNTPNIQDPEALDALMPWSPTLPSRLLSDADAPRIEPDEPIVDVDPHAIEGALEAIDSASSLAGDLSAKS